MNFENDPRVRALLDSACKKIFSRSTRENVRNELIFHLEKSAEDKIKAGIPPDEAINQALLEFGSAQTLAREFAITHRPTYLQIPFLAAGLAAFGIILLLFILETTRSGFEQARLKNQKSVELYRDRFLQDQTILSALPFFDFAGREHDAGAYLNEKLAWTVTDASLQKYLPKEPSLNFSRDVKSNLLDKGWLDQNIDIAGLDTSWFALLKSYDHWDLYTTGPLARLFSDHIDQPFWSMPLPDYTNLTAWSKIRLIRGVRERNVLRALIEVRQLARLSYTSEILIGDLIAVALLRLELETYQYSVSRHILNPGDWQPFSNETLIRARRSTYAFTQLFDLWGDPEFISTIFDGKTAKAGMCSALYERIAGSSMNRYFLENASPLEEDFTPRFAILDSITANSLQYCRLSAPLLHVWHNPAAARNWLTAESSTIGANFWTRLKFRYFLKIPILRRWHLAELEKQWTVDYMQNQYGKLLLPGEATIKDDIK